MLNIAYTHAISVVLVIFHYYMLQNKESIRYSLYSMTSVVVLFACPIKLNVSTRKGVTQVLPWIVKRNGYRTLAGVSVATYLRFVMSRVLRTC